MLEVTGLAALAAAGVAATIARATVAPGSRLFGRTLTAPANPVDAPPQIALTFDDGPNPRWTPQLLEVLAGYNVRATFFLIGRYAAVQRELVRRTHDAGHLIGNHTWTHPNLARTGSQQTREELISTTQELEQITGSRVRFFRPPYGQRRPATIRIARELGLIPVTWTIIGNDWAAPSEEYIITRAIRLIDRDQRRGKATNLVLHDGGHESLEADRSRSVAAAAALLARYAATHRFPTLADWA